jgi:two-component system chemotaxis response regulator CheB
LLGASAGGPRVLPELLARLPRDCAVPIIIVQHMTPAFAEHFCGWLSRQTALPVQEARAYEELSAGTVYLVLRGRSLVFSPARPPLLVNGQHEDNEPSVDALFMSAAKVFGRQSLAMLLSGMGHDGARGLKAIADAGGRTIVQSPQSAMIDGMPGEAIRLAESHEILTTDAMALALAAATVGHPRLPWIS